MLAARGSGLGLRPCGVPHAFLVTADGTEIRCLQTPGGCEAFTSAPASL